MVNATLLLNETGTTYAIMDALTTNVTGSEFLTFLLIYLIIISLTLAFKLDLEVSAILLIPLTIIMMVYQGEFLGFGAVLFLYIGVLIAKNFWFTK